MELKKQLFCSGFIGINGLEYKLRRQFVIKPKRQFGIRTKKRFGIKTKKNRFGIRTKRRFGIKTKKTRFYNQENRRVLLASNQESNSSCTFCGNCFNKCK